MRVLIVCSYRDFRPDGINQFIKEQVEAIVRLHKSPMNDERLTNERVEAEYYLVRGKGIAGYLKEIPKLRKAIREFQPDVIHAHYGLCGLLSSLATWRIPVVTTYHGSDINHPKPRKFSKMAMRLSAWNIFVSQKTMDIVHGAERKNCSLIPCGVDLTDDQLQTRAEARKALGWKDNERKVLFAGMFEEVKGPELAFAAINELEKKGIKVDLIELRGYSRIEVNRLMCAVDCLLMASKTEGSPQVIKEALACGCPIVSTDVGDVAERVMGVVGCYVIHSRDPKDMARAMEKAFAYDGKTEGREKVYADGLANTLIADKIFTIYRTISKNKG